MKLPEKLPDSIKSILRSVYYSVFKPRSKYYYELSFWKGRLEKDGGYFKNSHYKKLMLAMAGRKDGSFLQNKIVADFGCGPRGSLIWADTALAKIGIDVLTDIYADHFRSNIISHEMIYVKSTEKTIPLPSNYIDVLFTLNAIDHVNDFREMCREILRVIKPGGEFIGSFNLEEPPAKCEPQKITEELVSKTLLSNLEIQSYRVASRGPSDNVYSNFFTQDTTYKKGQQGFLWVRAKKPATSN